MGRGRRRGTLLISGIDRNENWGDGDEPRRTRWTTCFFFRPLDGSTSVVSELTYKLTPHAHYTTLTLARKLRATDYTTHVF